MSTTKLSTNAQSQNLAEVKIFRSATIVKFDDRTEPGKLIVRFTPNGAKKVLHAYAHPALACRLASEKTSPIADLAKEKKVLDLEILPTEEGWKFYECLRPSDERKKAFAEGLTAKPKYDKKFVTEADIQKNIDF